VGWTMASWSGATASRAGDLLFVSGQLPLVDGEIVHRGLVGTDVTVEQAREAAATAVHKCLDVAAVELGGVEKIKAVVKVNGYVAVAPGFHDAPAVIDAASKAVLTALGDRGKHSRLAIGVATLPLNACVEVEMVLHT
jgi:enamine deaminase RidA (YjgF/YER057c/UK114 family)